MGPIDPQFLFSPTRFSCFCLSDSLPHPAAGRVSERLGGDLAAGWGQPRTLPQCLPFWYPTVPQ